ncbi:hypothetical protein EX895_002965 [Sporisorium graminicola]|uniref:Uncharacterized protein n=1 Tax=Sporisorium graminicola TaxID=280036 RepID=A0A4U7KUE3_9BASI|nr:hypothetical protein EX895_002965 [Sporisorium graminicola]TKY88255.1 hypothetical protein EX895_002965 [Sporisorium graminicola]
MPFYILMITDIHVYSPLDALLVKDWFAFHYVHASYATAFFFTGEQSAVLDVLLKAQFLMARVRLLDHDEYCACMLRLSRVEGGADEGGNVVHEGSAVRLRDWLTRLHRDDAAQNEDVSDTDWHTTAVQTPPEHDDEDDISIDEDFVSDTDSDDDPQPTDPFKTNSEQQSGMNRTLLDKVCLDLYEELNLPAGSSSGAFI